jgi:hypothetical protein
MRVNEHRTVYIVVTSFFLTWFWGLHWFSKLDLKAFLSFNNWVVGTRPFFLPFCSSNYLVMLSWLHNPVRSSVIIVLFSGFWKNLTSWSFRKLIVFSSVDIFGLLCHCGAHSPIIILKSGSGEWVVYPQWKGIKTVRLFSHVTTRWQSWFHKTQFTTCLWIWDILC